MDAPAYNKLLELLDSAKLTLAANTESLSTADLRIRCLLNITVDETRRALLEIRAGIRVPATTDAAALARQGNGNRAYATQASSSR